MRKQETIASTEATHYGTSEASQRRDLNDRPYQQRRTFCRPDSTAPDNFLKRARLTLLFSAKQAVTKGITGLLIPMLILTSNAQQIAPLSKREAAIKRKVDQLSPDAHISVIPFHSGEEYGQFISGKQEGFTFYDVDRKTEITLRYADVRKIKSGYGGYNSAHQRHTDRTKALLIILAVAGALGGLIAAVGTSKN
jgi:hypothetical protein